MKYNPIIQRIVACVFMVGMLASCNQYNALAHSTSATLNVENLVFDSEGNIKSEKVLIHSNKKTYRLSGAINEDNQVTGTLILHRSDEDANYTSSLSNELENNTKLDKNNLYSHFYDTSNSLEEGDEVKITVNKETGEVLLFKKKGNGWKIVGVIFLVLGGLLLGLVILLLITCGCPHAYVFDGQKYHYTNTLFTGATAANLERHDFKILQDFQLDSDSYEMIIKNEENESHFINQLEMLLVQHDESTEVAPDQNGQIHSISNLEIATKIVDDAGQNISHLLSSRDDNAYGFDSDTKESMISAYATFNKPVDVSNAKVVVKLKNTEWGGAVYQTFASMMGDKYEKFVEKNHQRSPEEAKAGMKEAGIPMTISIKNGDHWVDVESIDLVGEINYNTLVATIDEELITGDNIELRFQAGFKFWDLDYVGMDFSADEGFEVTTIQPTLVDNKQDISAAIADDDQLYLEHLNKGDSTYFKFAGLKTESGKRTLILHSKGYYLSKDEYAGKTEWSELMKLRAPGGLSRLSKDIYEAYSNLVLEPSIDQ